MTQWTLDATELRAAPAAMASGSVLSINGRTAGLPIVSTATLPRVSQWLLIALMSLGAAPAGAAGGMKLTALFHAWRGSRRALCAERGLRITGIAATWIVTYALVLFLTFLALLATLPEMAADRLAFLAASALSNCGLSPEPVVLTGGGLWTLVAAMLVGRAAPLLVLWWVAQTAADVDVAV
jgi:Trk-type K+ transport system membrane component